MHCTARIGGWLGPVERRGAGGWSCARSSGGGQDASGGIAKAFWAERVSPGGRVGGPSRGPRRGQRGKRAISEAPAGGACGIA